MRCCIGNGDHTTPGCSSITSSAALALPWSADQAARYAAMASASVAEQQRIESLDSMLFEQYRLAYLSPDRLRA